LLFLQRARAPLTQKLESNMSGHLVLASLLSAASTTACIPIAADGALRTQGEIVGASNPCELQLFREGERGAPLQRLRVSGTFLETFVVAPTATTYRVDLLCNGSVQQSRAVRYEGAATYERPVQFGKVAL